MTLANTSSNGDTLERSVGVLYENLLRQRQLAQEEKVQRKNQMKAAEAEIKDDNDDPPQLTKEEKKKKIADSWRDVMTNLTGDDLEYTKPKKSKKKYKKWLGEEDGASVLTKKPKKKKKVNYTKEFEQELGMLKQIVAEQNRFTSDLSRRFQIMVGPATKDAGPLSKTAVELASAVVSSRANSLSIIKEISNIKKTVAQLVQKEREIDKKGSSTEDDGDLALMGSAIARDIFSQGPLPTANPGANGGGGGYQPTAQSSVAAGDIGSAGAYAEFNPADWTGSPNSSVDAHIRYETLPTETIVELNQDSEEYRFKTIRTDTMEELPDFPNPTFEIKKIDVENKMARDSFDTTYRLETV